MSECTLIVVSPAVGRDGRAIAGRYQARTGGNGRVLVESSRQPFFDAARVLLADGYEPETMLAMRHAGSSTEALRAPIGIAASLTVAERSGGVHLERYRPFSSSAVEAGTAMEMVGP